MKVFSRGYYLSHGKNPRGYGLWWFEAAGKTYSFNGMFAEAKKAAVIWARAIGANAVYVLP